MKAENKSESERTLTCKADSQRAAEYLLEACHFEGLFLLVG